MTVFRASRVARAGLALLAGAALALAPSGPASAIANGEPVSEGEYRFSVKLTMTGIPTPSGGRRNSACSGALIAPLWIVTAGHCFRDVNGVRVSRPVADLTTATVGRADLTGTNGQVAKVIAVRQSPRNDLAIAKLDAPIDGIEPVRLASAPPEVGDVVRLTGYGATDPTNIVPASRLHTGTFTVTTVDEVTLAVIGLAPEPDTSACPYDSGAPYFTESEGEPPVLVSVENTGPSCPHADEETTARVDILREWILQQMVLSARPLQLTSICASDPTGPLTWRVRNRIADAVDFTWDIYGTEQKGSGTVAGNGEVMLTTERSGSSTMRLFVAGKQVAVKAACSG